MADEAYEAERAAAMAGWERYRSITWEDAVKWADENGLWKLARRAGSKRLQQRYEGSGEGIGSSDINCAAVELIKGWMAYGTDPLERAGIVTLGIGNRIAAVKSIDEIDPWDLERIIDNLACEDKEMPTTTGGIAGPTGSAGWGSPQPPRKTTQRHIGAPGSPKPAPEIVEPAPEPKKQEKRAKQLIVGEKDPFLERLERYLNQNLGEMEDFQMLGALTGPAKPNTTGTGIGAKAKEIQQRVGVDNTQRSEGDLSKSPNATPAQADEEKEE